MNLPISRKFKLRNKKIVWIGRVTEKCNKGKCLVSQMPRLEK